MTETTPQFRLGFSSISTYRTCPQKYRLRYIDRLERLPSSEAKEAMKETGTWWHALVAAEAIERGRLKGSLLEGGIPAGLKIHDDLADLSTDHKELVNAVLEALSQWWDGQTPEYREAYTEKIGQPAPERLSYVFEEWITEYGEELNKRAPLAVELQFTRDLMPGVPPLQGTVDSVYRDEETGLVVVEDHKSHLKIATDSARVEMNESQLHVYAWAISAWLKEQGSDEPRALSYNRVRMKAPSSPVLTTTGSLSKSVTDYDERTYVEWARESPSWGTPGEFVKTGKNAGKPKFGTYELDPKELDRLNEPGQRDKWFKTTRVPVNINAVMMHLRAAGYSAEGMVKVQEMVQSPESVVPMNLGKACDWCEFSSLCRSLIFGGVRGEYDLEAHGLRTRPRAQEVTEDDDTPDD